MSTEDLRGRRWPLHQAVDLAANGHAGIGSFDALIDQHSRLKQWAGEQTAHASAAISKVIAGTLPVEVSKAEVEIAEESSAAPSHRVVL